MTVLEEAIEALKKKVIDDDCPYDWHSCTIYESGNKIAYEIELDNEELSTMKLYCNENELPSIFEGYIQDEDEYWEVPIELVVKYLSSRGDRFKLNKTWDFDGKGFI